MARKPSALATLDIVGEGYAQQDGLAERLSRQRAAREPAQDRETTPAGMTPARMTTAGMTTAGMTTAGMTTPGMTAAKTVAAGPAVSNRAGRGQATATPAAPAAARDHNAWRRGKALLQVAIPEDVHLELSILAKRRRMTLSHLVKDALNQWLDSHGHTLRLPE